MTEIQYHAAQARATDLGQQLRKVLAEINGPQAASLADRIITDPHLRPRLVFTGQYNSGKSTLIKALTDGAADVVIDSDIATDTVTEYDWDGLVSLVDTPGVQAGVARHDLIAEEAIASADLVIFAVTVDLFDDPAVDHLHHVADTLAKRDQLLIVITKANTMAAVDGVREAAVGAALHGSAGTVPWVESDARDYLDGLAHPDPARQHAYRQMSGIDGVRAAINDISARRGDLARYRQPLQVVIAVALETEALLTEDPTEAAALALLARQRSALTVRRERIEARLDDLRSGFLSESVRAAEEFADSIESIDDVPDGSERTARVAEISGNLNGNLTQAADRLAQAIARILTAQFDDLASEVREIEASPHTRVVLSLSQDARPSGSTPDIQVRGPMRNQSTPMTIPVWAPDARRWLKEFQVHWGAGSGVKASSGTAGHQIVLDVGHRLGTKFKPWQAARVANRIGRAVKVASVAVTVALEVAQVVTAERAEVRVEQERHKRRTGLVNEVLRQATTIVDEALADVRLQLDPVFQKAFDEIDSIHSEIVDARTQRTAASRQLARIRADATEALLSLA